MKNLEAMLYDVITSKICEMEEELQGWKEDLEEYPDDRIETKKLIEKMSNDVNRYIAILYRYEHDELTMDDLAELV